MLYSSPSRYQRNLVELRDGHTAVAHFFHDVFHLPGAINRTVTQYKHSSNQKASVKEKTTANLFVKKRTQPLLYVLKRLQLTI